MPDIVPVTPGPPATSIETEVGRLRRMTSENIRKEMVQALGMTVAGLVRMAACVRVLEDRGEDLSDLRGGLLGYVRQIAHGQTVPEAVVKFAGHRLLLSRVVALPLPEQRRLAEGGTVLLVVRREDGWDLRQARPVDLTGEQVHQVFATDHLRGEAEQKLLLESQAARPVRKLPAQQGKVRPDPERAGLIVNKTFVPQSEVLAALAALVPSVEAGATEEKKTLVIHISEAEHRALKVLAARSGVDMAEMVRRAMRAHGLLKPQEE